MRSADGGDDKHAKTRLRRMEEGRHPHPTKKKSCRFMDGAREETRQELAVAAEEDLGTGRPPAGSKEEVRPSRQGGREEERQEPGSGYGLSLPLKGTGQVCKAYGNTEENLVRLGHQARRWKAEKAAGLQEDEVPQAACARRRRIPRPRAGVQVQARRAGGSPSSGQATLRGARVARP